MQGVNVRMERKKKVLIVEKQKPVKKKEKTDVLECIYSWWTMLCVQCQRFLNCVLSLKNLGSLSGVSQWEGNSMHSTKLLLAYIVEADGCADTKKKCCTHLNV